MESGPWQPMPAKGPRGGVCIVFLGCCFPNCTHPEQSPQAGRLPEPAASPLFLSLPTSHLICFYCYQNPQWLWTN